MTLLEMSAEYRESGEKCRCRVRELNTILSTEAMGETERLLLRRRVSILSTMARDAIAISRYLENYYGGKKRNAEADDGDRL
jgi:hypothetical protein